MYQISPMYLPLAGKWKFFLDSAKEGLSKELFKYDLTDSVMLPGTTEENQKGMYNEACELNHLTRLYPFKGFAWYQRSIELDGELSRKHLRLFLERTKISHAWLDDRYMGSRDSLCTPHIYELPSDLIAGSYRLTILVDNDSLPPIGDPHQISDHTQTNWNGIIGRIELQAFEPVFIQDIKAYPDIENRKASIHISLKNTTEKSIKAKLEIYAYSFNSGGLHSPETQTLQTYIQCGDDEVRIDYQLGEEMILWDEYSPAMYRLSVNLQAETGGKTFNDHKEQTFGMRSFSASGDGFYVNGCRKVFLRGTHDACVFPLTGYSTMELNEWIKVFETAKAYGLNHYRFHSWCPPEAAFAAADIMGVYLQPELPNWASFYDPGEKNYNREHEEYLRQEGHRILAAYGNHPSFVLFSLGNELFGSMDIMSDMIRDFRRIDGRHLYAQGSNNFYSKPVLAEGDDFWLTMRTYGPDFPVRGSFAYANPPLGHIQGKNPPSTLYDYSGSICDINVPVIGHEVGQYQSFPDFDEIQEYTGVLRARNLEVFRKRLRDKGMLHQAEDFFQASGKLAAICYREDIEAALRTPGFGGFQLLDIKDFPGQGTALIGILNAFMKSKGFVEPEKWREFCSDAVLLARMPKYTYFSNEKLKIAMEIAYYGQFDLDGAIPEWQLMDNSEKILGSGEFPQINIKQGKVTTLGMIEIPENMVSVPERMTLVLRIKNSTITNSYPLWIYPPIEETGNDDIKIYSTIDTEVKDLLEEGRSILVMPGGYKPARSVGGMFASDFWCYPMFRDTCRKMDIDPSPGTLGILCDPSHPAFGSFPTEFHSNWQWWAIAINSNPLILDDMPMSLKPIVQVIDNFERNHRLGLLLEAKVGNGKILLLSSDLYDCMGRPEVRQLLRSLKDYMQSDLFNPDTDLSIAQLEQILMK